MSFPRKRESRNAEKRSFTIYPDGHYPGAFFAVLFDDAGPKA